MVSLVIFLNFVIPLIIVGFVAPGIGDLGDGAGKLLAVTAGLAYGSTIISGSIAYFTASTVLPKFLQEGSLVVDAANPEEALLSGFFNVDMPPIFGGNDCSFNCFYHRIRYCCNKGGGYA